jgi:membrane-bound metal-dependent hydrolase YbcI (DUF457 family)
MVVALAYVPDMVAQPGLIAGWRAASRAGHSLLFAAVFSFVLALVLVRLAPPLWRRTAATAFLSLVLHDIADILSTTGRTPLWPVSRWSPDSVADVLPSGIIGELLVFLPFALAAYGWRHWGVSGHGGDGSRRDYLPARVMSATGIMGIAAVAVLTSHLRTEHARALRQARAFIEQHDYVGAMDAADRADWWPSATRRSRIDYVRAEAALGVGDRDAAEQYYRRSYRADPAYFWPVADLAVLYASADASDAERHRLSAPWVEILRTQFAFHPALAPTIARVERALARHPVGAGVRDTPRR